MTIENAKNIIWNAINEIDDSYDAFEIQFMGGEPLVKFELIKEICEWLWHLELKTPLERISAPTNGTLIKPDMIGWLQNNKERFNLLLSFDGNRLMQNKNRSGSANSIDLGFFATTYPECSVKMTISPNTLKDFYNGVLFLYKQGFKIISANLAYGSNIDWEKHHLEILREELDKLVGFYSSNVNILPLKMLQIPVWNILDLESEGVKCYCGRDLLCYDCDGQIYPCHIFSPITLPREKAIRSQSLNLDKARKEYDSLCAKCLLKKACVTCYGINYRDRGNCLSQSPFYCAQFKLFFYASCKLHKKLAVINGDKDKEEAVDKTIDLLTKTIKYGKI